MRTWPIFLAVVLTLGAAARDAWADDTDWALDLEQRVKHGYSPTREETVRYQNVAHRVFITGFLNSYKDKFVARSGDTVVLDVMPDLSADKPVELTIALHPGELLDVAALTSSDVVEFVGMTHSQVSSKARALPSKKTDDGGYIVMADTIHGASDVSDDVITLKFTCTSTDPHPLAVVVFGRGRKVEAPAPTATPTPTVVAAVEPSTSPPPTPSDTVEPDQTREDHGDALTARLGFDVLTPSAATSASTSYATIGMERIVDGASPGSPSWIAGLGYTVGYATNFEGDLHFEVGGSVHTGGIHLAVLGDLGMDMYQGQFDHRGYYAGLIARVQLGLGRVGLVGTAALLTGGEQRLEGVAVWRSRASVVREVGLGARMVAFDGASLAGGIFQLGF